MAARVAQYIDTHGGVWPRQQMRLTELIKLPDIGGWRVRRKIYDQDNRLVLDEGGPLVSPAVGRSAPIVVAGSTIGVFVVEESLQNTLYNTWLVAFACSLIGYGAYFALRIFPLRVLDRTIGELHDTQRSLAVQMERLDVALNNMSQGLVIDSSACLVVVSRRYLEMFGLSPDTVKPGCTILEVLDQRGPASASAASATGKLLASVAQGKTFRKITNLPDGRIISIVNQPLADGGVWVATHEDITERRLAEKRSSTSPDMTCSPASPTGRCSRSGSA